MKILERFKNGKLAVNCIIEDESKKFIEMCYDNNIKWRPASYDINTINRSYGKETSYECKDSYLYYANRGYYEEVGYEIITFQEFKQLLEEEKNMFTKNMLEVGKHVVKYRNGDKRLVLDGFFTHINGFMDFSDFKDNLLYCNNFGNGFDIVSVYTINQSSKFKYLLDENNLTLIWERQEKSKEELEHERQIEKFESLINDLEDQLSDAKNRLKDIK